MSKVVVAMSMHSAPGMITISISLRLTIGVRPSSVASGISQYRAWAASVGIANRFSNQILLKCASGQYVLEKRWARQYLWHSGEF